MQSDGYGGGTTNMEFQTLTGLPFYNLSPTVSVLYTEVLPKIHMVPSISNAYKSKDKIAVHLAEKSNYSRDIVYSRLDFKDFITINSKGINIEKKELVLVMNPPYNIVLDNLNDKIRTVLFWDDHAKSYPWLEANPETLDAKAKDLGDEENSKLTFYSRLLSQTGIPLPNPSLKVFLK